MILLQKAQELRELATQIKTTCESLEHFKHKLNIASVSLVLLALNCPDIETAHKNGTVAKMHKAFESNRFDISLSLPIIVGFVQPNGNIRPIKTWDELIDALKIVEP